MSDATTPAVVQDAQRVIKQVTEVVRAADRAFESSGGSSRHWVREQFIPRLEDAGLCIVPAAYIERLEAERDALLAEHEAVGEGYGDETADAGCDCLSCRIIRAHDNAERVLHQD